MTTATTMTTAATTMMTPATATRATTTIAANPTTNPARPLRRRPAMASLPNLRLLIPGFTQRALQTRHLLRSLLLPATTLPFQTLLLRQAPLLLLPQPLLLSLALLLLLQAHPLPLRTHHFLQFCLRRQL